MGCRICKCKTEQMLRSEREFDRLEMMYDEIFELLDGMVRGIIDVDDINVNVKEILTEHETWRYGVNPQEAEDFGYSENVR